MLSTSFRKNSRPCLFLDRDGIINNDVGYAFKPEQIHFMPGIFTLCRYFQQRGYLIVIVTNQSGIARGYYSEEDFKTLSDWMIQEFKKRQIQIDLIKHCPHHPKITGECDCRKPKPGMLTQAIEELNINPTRSIMIGDKASDMQAGQAAGIEHNIWLNPEHVLYQHKPPYNCLKVRNLLQLRALLS